MEFKRKLALVVALMAAAALASAGGALAAFDAFHAFDATDMELVDAWIRVLQARDRAGLEELLSPQFLLTRADGTHVGKEEYLDNPAIVDEYVITNVVGRSLGNVRVVRYDLASIEWIDGVELTRDPVVRMSVFYWTGERWQLLAHANFINIWQ